MNKFESKDKNALENWLEASKDKAPASLMHKIMAQVNVEPLNSIEMYSTRMGLRFKIIAASVFTILLAMALSLPTSNLGIINKLSSFKLPEIQLPEFAFLNFKSPLSIPPYYLLIIAAIFGLLFLFDRLLNKLFKRE